MFRRFIAGYVQTVVTEELVPKICYVWVCGSNFQDPERRANKSREGNPHRYLCHSS
jgi:hypothetical protein